MRRYGEWLHYTITFHNTEDGTSRQELRLPGDQAATETTGRTAPTMASVLASAAGVANEGFASSVLSIIDR